MFHTAPLRFLTLLALALLGAHGTVRAQQLEVRVINVDQGLAVFVRSPSGTRLLIDAGNPGDGTGIVRPYLQSIGVTGLDYTVMTHWHTDHFGGLTEIHNSPYKPLVAAYDRGDLNRPSNGFVTSYLSAVSGKRAVATVGQTLNLGGGATLQFLSRDGVYSGGSVNVSGDENAHSLGMVLRYGDFDLYVAGDLTAGGLSTPPVEGPVSALAGQVEVAISSHHGSSSSSSNTVVNNLNPSLVVHSAGHDNPYGHPTETVVNAWSTSAATRVQWCTTEGDTVLATGGDPGGFNSVNGTILITSDGASFTASSAAQAVSLQFATFEQPGTLAGLGQLVVNELLVDPLATSDAFGEWFELMNVSAQTLNLGGLRIESGAQNFTLRSQALVPPGERFVVGVDGRLSRNGNVFPGVNAPWQSFALANGSGSLTLRAAGGQVIETVTWGGSGISVTPGVSAERKQPTSAPLASNFADALTAWAGADKGTPWAPNDNQEGACPTPIPYGVGKLTSNLTVPYVTWSGTPSVDTNDFSITLVDALPLKSTVAFWGSAAASAPFLGGTRYVANPVQRMGVTTTNSVGSVTYAVPVTPSMAGLKRYYQFWFRDPLHPDGTNAGLSSALEVQFCPLAPPPVAGDVVVTEYLRDPTAVADADGEWIELYNTTNYTLNLQGWLLTDNSGESAAISAPSGSLFVSPGQRVVVGVNANTASNGGVALDGTYAFANFRLLNSVDQIVLRAPDGTEIDRIEYDSVAWPSFPGASAGAKPGVYDHVLNDNPNNWCSASSPIGAGPDSGTPHAPNDPCP